MSPNKDRPHVFVLPEDDANRAMANGFYLQIGAPRQMQLLGPAGGWNKVLRRFKSDHEKGMKDCPDRFMILLIDFDGRSDRLKKAKSKIPKSLAHRVFVLGALSEPEDLKKGLGSFERIGSAMADDCREETDTTWGHKLLRHNASELERLPDLLRSILF